MDCHLKHFKEPLFVHLPGWELKFVLEPDHSFFWGGTSQQQKVKLGVAAQGFGLKKVAGAPGMVASSEEELSRGGTSR